MMKKILVILTLIIAVVSVAPAQAGLDMQMNQILGHWIDDASSRVLLVQQQSSTAIKVFYCDKIKYYETNGFCEYRRLEVYNYNQYLDSFYIQASSDVCARSIQVSIETPLNFVMILDPFRTNNCEVTGLAHHFLKISR